MRQQRMRKAGMLLGVGILLLGVSVGLPKLVFWVQDSMKAQSLVIREDTPVSISLSKNPAEVSLSYRAKMELAAAEDAVAIALHNETTIEESMSMDTKAAVYTAMDIVYQYAEDQELRGMLKNALATVKRKDDYQVETSLFATGSSYAILLMDRSDFNRQYKAWEVFVRIGDCVLGGWLDDETGRYTAIWYGDAYIRIPQETLLEYYGEEI